MVTAPVQATQQGTATRSSQPGAHTGSPALGTAPWMSSTPPLPSGQSACLPLWGSLPICHSGKVCLSTTLAQSVPSDRSDWPRVCLSVHLPVHICSLVVMGLLHVAYPDGSTCLIPTRQAQQAPPPSSIIKQGVICLSVCVQAVAQEPGQQPGDSRRSLHCAQPSPVPQQGQHLAHCHHRPGFHCRICPSSSRYYHCYPTCT